jgi:hypothetical protein
MTPVRLPKFPEDRRLRRRLSPIPLWSSDRSIDVDAEGSDLLIRALYLVVPGLSESEEAVKPLEGEYLLDPRATAFEDDRIAILYGQDEQGNYGNLLVVDFRAKTVIPDIPSVIAR